MSNMPMAIATNTSAVPRSGWSMISPVGTASRARANATWRARRGGSRRARAAATARITATLAASAGWSWKGPIWNQAWVPRTSSPSAETTRASAASTPPYASQAKSRRRR